MHILGKQITPERIGDHVSVRPSLLAILDQGPCYGYQLRAEFERRTGGAWPVNVGQVYNTLERLERDGLVAKADVSSQGHVYWRITEAGRAAVADWFASPVDRGPGTRDEATVKIALAATLPGVDVDTAVAAQLQACENRLSALRQATFPGEDPSSPAGQAWGLVQDAMIAAADAEHAWLRRARTRFAQGADDALELPLDDVRPRRGRPTGRARTDVVD
ncbi:PadR family transcriptional regulator [Microbacterium aquimaris]|uniref:PadR family transcriptional regulator n=1 Tax=Microbacterium aquimaris TaxID=459816 RepID=UPI0039068EA1